MSQDIYVNLGGGLTLNEEVRVFIEIQQQYPQWFHSDVLVNAVFDSFPGLVWNGGRILDAEPAVTMTEMRERVSFFNVRNIGVNFTFSNGLLSKKHLLDESGNAILRAFENEQNGVILSSVLLRKHIKQNYPRYKLFYSLTNAERDQQALLAVAEDYDRIVIPQEYSLDIPFLRKFPKDKAEIPLNDHCVPFCPYKKYEINYINQVNLEICQFTPKPFAFCRQPTADILEHEYLTLNDMRSIYAETGIKYFKCATRTKHFSDRLKDLIRYFVKEEFSLDFRSCINQANEYI
jgi:hypothetical protein